MSRYFSCLKLTKKSKLPARGLLVKFNLFKLVGLVGKAITFNKLLQQLTFSNFSQLVKSRPVNLLLSQLSFFKLMKSFKFSLPSRFSCLISNLVIFFLFLPKLCFSR